nr:hypothetical protein [Metabacillus kandeliae]
MYKRAAELSIPIPATWYPNDWDKDGSIPDDIPYPCIVKPIEQRSFYEAFQKKAITAESREELADAIAAAAPHPVVVQEIVGEALSDFYSLCTYVDTTGEVKGYFTGRKLEQYPQSFGTGCLVESSPVDEFVADAAKILNAAGYYGISEIEFIYDKRDGSYKLLDVNTRVWKWIGLPVFAGVNLPLLAYRDALGLPIGQEHPVKDYAKWVYYQDYMSLKQERPNHVHGHLTDEELTHFVSGKMPSGNLIDAVYDEDDPTPSVRLLKNQYQSGYVCPC